MTTDGRERWSPPTLFAALGMLLFLAALAGLSSGVVGVGPWQAIGVVLDRLGLDTGIEYSPTQEAVVWSIRLPRVVLGSAVGAALGLSGAAFQAVFRNPMADPQLIGVSSGAALGSVFGVLALHGTIGGLGGAIGGTIGAVAVAVAVYSFARHDGRTEVVTMVLGGLAIGAIAAAAAAFLSVAIDDARLGSVTFYGLGSLAIATWERVRDTLPFVVVAVALLPLLARELDLMLMGEREARHLGVDVDRVRTRVGVLGGAAVGGSVAAVGSIGFVGLIVPHAVRRVAGPRHAVVLPASALGGASVVVVADIVARIAASPIEIPIGLITTIVGGPVFLVLLWRTRQRQGGWG